MDKYLPPRRPRYRQFDRAHRLDPRRGNACSGLQVFSWSRGMTSWDRSCLGHPTIETRDRTLPRQLDSADVVVFISPRGYSFSCLQCADYLERWFDFMPQFWEPSNIDGNGGFYHSDGYNNAGDIVAKETWGRFLVQQLYRCDDLEEELERRFFDNDLSVFFDIDMFTHWNLESKKTRIYFFNLDSTCAGRVMPAMVGRLRESAGLLCDPLWMYPIVLTDYLNMQHAATFFIRDLTEYEQEKAEQVAVKKLRSGYARLHKIARFAMVLCEILMVNIKSLEHIVECHSEFMRQRAELNGESTHPVASAQIRQTHHKLQSVSHSVYSIHCRCSSYLSSIQNVIQLIFNVVAQEDTRASVAIAQATKVDSEFMKLTSFVALLFLPPTFISAIFSTTFFSFGGDAKSWQVSEQFYWYFIVTIPVTAGCLVLWYRIFRRRASIFRLEALTTGVRLDAELSS